MPEIKDRKYFIKYLVHECVRNNTSLEKLHGEGKITDKEMKEFIKGVCDNLVGFLRIWKSEGKDFIPLPKKIIDTFGWDNPQDKFIPNFLHLICLIQDEFNGDKELFINEIKQLSGRIRT